MDSMFNRIGLMKSDIMPGGGVCTVRLKTVYRGVLSFV